MINRLADPNQKLPEYVKGYINHPRETFNCELKSWLDPTNVTSDKIKIAKSCLALRNWGGGVILVGISNSGNFLPLPQNYNPETHFTQDNIQAIVSHYSQHLFGVDVHHVELCDPANYQLVAIIIPSDIKTPVMCKHGAPTACPTLLEKAAIYTRTLEANGTISSAIASQADLERITQTCFDNRSADIGKFLRDHLTQENLETFMQIANVTREDIQSRTQNLQNFAETSATEALSIIPIEGNKEE